MQKWSTFDEIVQGQKSSDINKTLTKTYGVHTEAWMGAKHSPLIVLLNQISKIVIIQNLKLYFFKI